MVNGNPDKKLTVRDRLQTPRYGPTNIPVPSMGGQGYSEDTRVIAVELYNDVGRVRYLQYRDTTMPHLPHPRSCRRFMKRLAEIGMNVRMKHTGNSRKDGIHGFPVILLAAYRMYYPKATRYECIAFLWRSYGSTLTHPRVYSLNDVTEAENALGINRKKGSTTAHQAYTHRNLLKRDRFWTLPYPDGIADISRDDMIDIDECGLKLETANRRHGKGALSRRVRERGNYGHGINHTLIFAISGAPAGLRWANFSTAGTNIGLFHTFILQILASIGIGTPGNRKCFTMDNYIAHHNPLILNAIIAAGHRYVFRAPYYPVDGPIEYVFNTIEFALAYRHHEIKTVNDLQQHVFAIIRLIPNFVNYFINVGFAN